MTEAGTHARVHTLQMERRRHAVITGVTDVCSFHETEIVLRIDAARLVITGENLHIGKLLLDEGKVDVEGQFDGFVYEKPGLSSGGLRFWKRRESEA